MWKIFKATIATKRVVCKQNMSTAILKSCEVIEKLKNLKTPSCTFKKHHPKGLPLKVATYQKLTTKIGSELDRVAFEIAD